MRRITAFLAALAMLFLCGTGFAGDLPGNIYIDPVGDYPMTENGYVFTDDVLIEWSCENVCCGYTYLIEDPQGYDVPGYSDQLVSDNTGVTLYAADFVPGEIYRITVYAHAANYDPYPASNVEWFVFSSDGSSGGYDDDDGGYDDDGAQAADAKDKFRSFYESTLYGCPVALADVTGDGVVEMIVVVQYEGFAEGCVYALDSCGGVSLIYSNFLPDSHGGVCGWYLLPRTEGGYSLLEESDELWQGYGNLFFEEYLLTLDGYMVPLDNLWLSSNEENCVDADGMLLDFLVEDYTEMLGSKLITGWGIWVRSSLSDEYVPMLNMEPSLTFGSSEDPNSLVSSRGLVALMSMEHEGIVSVLEDAVWYESFDFYRTWHLEGSYAGGRVLLTYDMPPDAPGAYPFSMIVFDDSGNACIPVIAGLHIGMSWAQVKALDWVYLDDMYGDEEFAIATGYPEQGCCIDMQFTECSDDGVLTRVTLGFFE